MARRRPLTLAAWGALAAALSGCGGGLDVVPASHDVREVAADPQASPGGGTDRAAAADPGGYVFTARRRHGAVGLAEARGLPAAEGARVTREIADALERCAETRLQEGKLVDGAVRVVAAIGDDGAVSGVNVTLPPGGGVAANALLCVIAPLKLVMFSRVATGALSPPRGVALEASWGATR